MELDEKTLALVRALAAEMVAQQGPAKPAGGCRLTVRELWEQYRSWGRANIPSWRTVQGVHEPHILEFFGNVRIDDVVLGDVDAFRAKLRTVVTYRGTVTAPATRNRIVTSLRACFSWAVKRRKETGLTANPLAGVDMEDELNIRETMLEEADFERISAAADTPKFRLMLIAFWDTGARCDEIRRLQRSQVDLERAEMTLMTRGTKGKKGRVVPLTPRVVDAFRTAYTLYPRSKWVFPRDPRGRGAAEDIEVPYSTLRKWFRRAISRAGIQGVGDETVVLHMFRHSCATRMRRRGVAWSVIKYVLGWRSDSVAQRYQHVAWADVEEARAAMMVDPERRRAPKRRPNTAEDAALDRAMEAMVSARMAGDHAEAERIARAAFASADGRDDEVTDVQDDDHFFVDEERRPVRGSVR